MIRFKAKIRSYIPYPVEHEETILASEWHTAFSRAFKEYRKHLRKTKGKKKLTKVIIELDLLTTFKKGGKK